MSGYAQMTIRRNRDGSFVVITESTEQDPQYEQFDSYATFRVLDIAGKWLDKNVEGDG